MLGAKFVSFYAVDRLKAHMSAFCQYEGKYSILSFSISEDHQFWD